MTGMFSEWQPAYAEHGIATFPVKIFRGHDGKAAKVPAVKNYGRFGLRGSSAIAERFADAEAIAFMAGKRSRITPLDVDTSDERVLAQALDKYGRTQIITRSGGSGHFQAWYRHNREKRAVRQLGNEPIDVLGGGVVVAPPSKGLVRSYEFIQGGLDDIDSLPTLSNLPAHIYPYKQPETREEPAAPPNFIGMRQGDGRNRALWERCMRTGHSCSPDRMMEIARNANQMFKEPMMDTEVVKIATSAWQHDAAGLNFFIRPRVMLDHDVVDGLGNSDAVALLVRLERYHGGNNQFILANEMAPSMGWGLARWRAARDCLISARVIKRLTPGGRGPHDPPIYGWTLKGA